MSRSRVYFLEYSQVRHLRSSWECMSGVTHSFPQRRLLGGGIGLLPTRKEPQELEVG